MVELTETQKNRLIELGEDYDIINKQFYDKKEKEEFFRNIEKQAVKRNKLILEDLINEKHRPELCVLQEKLAKALCDKGFTQVTTPSIISSKALEKMTVTSETALYKQVFWLDSKTCLRPMLAPNLYEISRQLMNIQKKELRIFEIGSCFRKESEGKSHLKEFTMLNLVEWGTPLEERKERLKEFAVLVLEAAGIKDYCFEDETSVVYGQGLDVVGKNGLELASTSMGPHSLDVAWKINSTWVGIGFGLERLLMYRENEKGIHRYSKSLSFLDGASMKVR